MPRLSGGPLLGPNHLCSQVSPEVSIVGLDYVGQFTCIPLRRPCLSDPCVGLTTSDSPGVVICGPRSRASITMVLLWGLVGLLVVYP